jgi:hypothetical protein
MRGKKGVLSPKMEKYPGKRENSVIFAMNSKNKWNL